MFVTAGLDTGLELVVGCVGELWPVGIELGTRFIVPSEPVTSVTAIFSGEGNTVGGQAEREGRGGKSSGLSILRLWVLLLVFMKSEGNVDEWNFLQA